MPEIDITGTSNTPSSSSPLNSPGDYSKGPLSRNDLAAMQVQARQTKVNYQQRQNAQKQDQNALRDSAKAAKLNYTQRQNAQRQEQSALRDSAKASTLNFRQRRDAERQERAALRDSGKAATLNYRQRINNQKEVKRLQDQEFNKAYKLAAWEVANEKTIQSTKDKEFNKAYKLGAWEVANEKEIKRLKDEEFNKAYALGRWEQSNERYIDQKKDKAKRDQEIAADKKYREYYALAQHMNRDFDIQQKNNGGGFFSRGGSSWWPGGGLVGGSTSALRDVLSSLPGGGIILGALDLGKDLISAPQELTGIYNAMYEQAKPLIDLKYAGAALGRAGGYDNSSWSDALTNGKGDPLDWMQQYGVGANDVAPIIQTLGASRFSDQASALTAARSVFAASQSQYLGVLDPGTLAGMGGNFLTYAGRYTGLASPSMQGGSLNQYYSKLQSVMQAAVSYGLDSSKVGATMDSLLTNAASQGASSISTGGLADFWNRMASSGDPNMRGGQGILNAQAAYSATADTQGYGGNNMATQAFQYEANKHGGLKKIGSSMKAAAAFLGVDLSNASPETMRQVKNFMQAASIGDLGGAATMAVPLEKGNPNFAPTMWQDYANSMPWLPQYQRDWIAGGGAGGGQQGYNDAIAFNVGGSQPPLQPAVGFGAASFTGQVNSAIATAAKATGLDPNLLAGLIGHESSGNVGAVNPKSGASGLGQILQSTYLDLYKKGVIRKDISWADITSDPTKSATASAEVLQYYMSKHPGDLDSALAQYGGQMNKDGTYKSGAWGYINDVEGRELAYAGQGVGGLNQEISRLQQMNINNAQPALQGLNTLQGDSGALITALDKNATDMQASIAQFGVWVTKLLTGQLNPSAPSGPQYPDVGRGRPNRVP